MGSRPTYRSIKESAPFFFFFSLVSPLFSLQSCSVLFSLFSFLFSLLLFPSHAFSLYCVPHRAVPGSRLFSTVSILYSRPPAVRFFSLLFSCAFEWLFLVYV